MLRPKQNIPFSQKNDDWVENCVRYYSNNCVPAVNHSYADMLYRAANGELDESDYTYVMNPLHSKKEKYKKFPSKIRNFDIISTYVLMLMGEKRRRGTNFTVVARNSDIETIKKDRENQLVNQMLYQMTFNEFILQAMSNGEEPNLEQVEQLTAEKIRKEVDNIQDKVAINGQNALDYILDFNEYESKAIENWYHWITQARAFTYRYNYRDEVIFENVSPKEMYYMADSRTRFIEDAEAQERRVRLPLNEVIDKFQSIKGWTEDIEKALEAKANVGSDEASEEIRHFSDVDPGAMAANEMWNRIRPQRESALYSDDTGIEVRHVVWTSMVKIGLVKLRNVFGEEFTEYVDEDYIARPDEQVEWRWAQQKWHAYLIDEKYVLGGEPLYEFQGTWEQPFNVKGPYNGRIFNMKHVNPQSIVERGIPYQIKYNIIHYYIEKTMAKNLDQIVVLPMGLIPEKEGLDMEASMYYASAMGFLFVDDSSPKFSTAIQGIKVLNAGLSQHLNQLYQYLQVIKLEWESLIGVNPQRKGQMNASDGKATTENAVFRSSIMTEEYFAQFEELEERDLNSMLNLSRFAFSEGKKTSFINKDFKEILLSLGEDYSYWDYLVRASKSGKDQEELQLAKAQAQAIAQNANGKFSTMMKLIRSNNISKIIEEMEKEEERLEQMMLAQQQADRESQERIAELNTQAEQAKLDAIIYKADSDKEKSIEVARIGAEAKLMMDFYNSPDGAADEARAVTDASIKREELNSRNQVELKKIQADREKSKEDNETKKYVADQQLKIAKENKSM